MGKEINTGSSVILHYRTYPLNYKKTLVCLLLLSFGKNNWTGILGDLPSWEHIISSYPTFGKRKNHLRGWSVGVLGYDSMGIPGIYCQLGFFVCYNSPTKKTEPEKQSSISWRFLFFEVSMVSMDQISPQDQDRSTYTSVFPWKSSPQKSNRQIPKMAFPEFNTTGLDQGKPSFVWGPENRPLDVTGEIYIFHAESWCLQVSPAAKQEPMGPGQGKGHATSLVKSWLAGGKRSHLGFQTKLACADSNLWKIISTQENKKTKKNRHIYP